MDERHIVAIDLGTSKFAVSVAKIEGDNMQVIYYRETPSDGISDSRVLKPKNVSQRLGEAIRNAEEELGMKISQVVVGMPKYEVSQNSASIVVERDPRECITYEEIKNLKEMAMDTYPLQNPQSEVLFGAVAQSFSDGEEFQLVEDDIIGMISDRIEGNFKLFIGKSKPLEAINKAFDLIGVTVARKYFTPDSTAKAVLRDAEIDNGVALIDFGAGVTSLSIYYGGIMRHYAAIPFGGKLITRDIKSEASITDRLAENIKLAYGACMPDRLQNMSEKIIYISSETAAPAKQIPVKYLSEIITARTREIINAILYEIERSGFADQLKSGVVITGGGACLTNCANLIQEMSGYNVRTGYPRAMFSVSGCEGVFDPGAATSIGMLLTAKQEYALNCCPPADMENKPAETTPPISDKPSVDKNGQGILEVEFEEISKEERKRKEEEEKKKKKEAELRKKQEEEARKKREKENKVSWFNIFGEKLKNKVEKAYETVSNEVNEINKEEV